MNDLLLKILGRKYLFLLICPTVLALIYLIYCFIQGSLDSGISVVLNFFGIFGYVVSIFVLDSVDNIRHDVLKKIKSEEELAEKLIETEKLIVISNKLSTVLSIKNNQYDFKKINEYSQILKIELSKYNYKMSRFVSVKSNYLKYSHSSNPYSEQTKNLNEYRLNSARNYQSVLNR